MNSGQHFVLGNSLSRNKSCLGALMKQCFPSYNMLICHDPDRDTPHVNEATLYHRLGINQMSHSAERFPEIFFTHVRAAILQVAGSLLEDL
jgi:hypothetical protein